MAHVELKGVTKRFGAFEAVRNLSFAVQKGSFVALLGPSGCGKSTLLRLIAGLEDTSEGEILINGRDVTDVEPAERKIAMVFQSYALYPHLTVRQNVGFPLSIAHRPKAEIVAKTQHAAAILHLEDLLDRKPAQLSGGQRQRVAIGRALVREPEVFLFDEPLSNLDAMLRVQMRLELAKLHRELKTTMIYVTHDQVEAMTLADTIVVMNKGEISQIGTPLELYHRPANRFVASFIGLPAMNFFSGKLSPDGKTILLPEGNAVQIPKAGTRLPPGIGAIDIGIRPEHIALVNDPRTDVIPGTVQLAERLGSATVLYCETPLGTMVVQCGGNELSKPGDRVFMALKSDGLHFFDQLGNALQI